MVDPGDITSAVFDCLLSFALSVVLGLFHLFHPVSYGREARIEERNMPTGHSTGASSFRSSPSSTLEHNEVQSYCDLAQRLRLLTPDLNQLGLDDIQIIDTTAFASGSSSEVWQGSFQGSVVAVKSLRCYSNPEFDPAEVGIVSLTWPVRLRQR